MQQKFNARKTVLAVSIGLVLGVGLGACGGGGGSGSETTEIPANPDGPTTTVGNPWMTSAIIAEQAAATTDTAKEAVANRRASLLIAAMTLGDKQQQLTGAAGIIPELPNCYGARHVPGLTKYQIPTLRVSNGPVGIGQNDCVPPGTQGPDSLNGLGAITSANSAKATALPSAMAVAASFDPAVATQFGNVIGVEANNLALHVLEGPGMNMARIPVLGRNFEYMGEDPYLVGALSTAEIQAIQSKGVIAMAKHFVANEQETNRMTIQESIDDRVLHELYLLPFEMSVKDGKVASVMCSYNAVNSFSMCENKYLMTDVLRSQWGFSGYVQSDFWAVHSAVPTMLAGLDHEMPGIAVAAYGYVTYWTPTNITAALATGQLTQANIDTALTRRYTQMFKMGIFDRPVAQTSINATANGATSRSIGEQSAVLLKNTGSALPLRSNVQKVVVIGKATQVYAQQAVAGGSSVGNVMGTGGGSSDVVALYTVAPVLGIQDVLKSLGNSTATVTLVTVKDDNSDLAAAQAAAAGADAVIVMAGSIAEEGADLATFTDSTGLVLDSAKYLNTLDWYGPKSSSMTTTANVKSSNTVAMIQGIVTANPKSVLVLKDNASVVLDPTLLSGAQAPAAILEAWFPGQEDGHIVADLLFGVANPSGKLPVTFPQKGQGFMDSIATTQYPGVMIAGSPSVTYSEGLNMGYRWYDANSKTPAFEFGYGLSYTTFSISGPAVAPLASDGTKPIAVTATVQNTGTVSGAEVVQVYIGLPATAKAPPKRLVGFKKVTVAPGASAKVSITVDPKASNHPLSYWDRDLQQWVVSKGAYPVYVGNSSRNATLIGTLTITP